MTINLSPWIYAPIAFLFWVVLLSLAKHFLYHRIRTWTEKTGHPAGRDILSSLRYPLNILILGLGVLLLERLLPLTQEVDFWMSIAVKIFLIVALFMFLDSLIRLSLRRTSIKVQQIDLSQGIMYGLIRIVVFSLGLLVLAESLGISITPIIASLGIASLAVALALQSTLSNLFAGIFILLSKPFHVGDFIKLPTGQEGHVIEIGWRNTKVKLPLNIVVIVPNEKLISGEILNYHFPEKEMSLSVPLGVAYGSDLDKVERVSLEVARHIQHTVPGAVGDFEPVLRYQGFDDSNISFNVVFRVREVGDQPLVKHEFIKAIHKKYQAEGITIPFPSRDLHIAPETIRHLEASLGKGKKV